MQELDLKSSLHKTLPGVVCPQMVQCGKVGCKCQRGELHGPYYYRFWREDGRLRKEYVPRSQLHIVKAQCDRRRRQQQETKAAREQAREISHQIKQVEQLINASRHAPNG